MRSLRVGKKGKKKFFVRDLKKVDYLLNFDPSLFHPLRTLGFMLYYPFKNVYKQRKPLRLAGTARGRSVLRTSLFIITLCILTYKSQHTYSSCQFHSCCLTSSTYPPTQSRLRPAFSLLLFPNIWYPTKASPRYFATLPELHDAPHLSLFA